METQYKIDLIDAVLEVLEELLQDINSMQKKQIIKYLKYQINDYKVLKGLYLAMNKSLKS